MEKKQEQMNKKQNNSKKSKSNTSSNNKRQVKQKKQKLKQVVDELTQELEVIDNTIEIDSVRLEDNTTLDTSFLEGRRKKPPKIYKEKKESKKKEVDTEKKEKRIKYLELFGVIFLSIIIGIMIGILSGLGKKTEVKQKVVEKEKTVEKVVMDENIVFLGDSNIDFYELEKYYEGLPVVNSGVNGNVTEQVLDKLDERVYRYNPSKVIILIGTNDYLRDLTNEEIRDNIKKIIEQIKEHRKYAKIYLQSIYPVNDTDDEKISHSMVNKRDNKTIQETNKLLESLAKEEKITYIDMYKILVDDDNNLKLEYTKDGLHISDEGYKVITVELMKYIKE